DRAVSPEGSSRQNSRLPVIHPLRGVLEGRERAIGLLKGFGSAVRLHTAVVEMIEIEIRRVGEEFAVRAMNGEWGTENCAFGLGWPRPQRAVQGRLPINQIEINTRCGRAALVIGNQRSTADALRSPGILGVVEQVPLGQKA